MFASQNVKNENINGRESADDRQQVQLMGDWLLSAGVHFVRNDRERWNKFPNVTSSEGLDVRMRSVSFDGCVGMSMALRERQLRSRLRT